MESKGWKYRAVIEDDVIANLGFGFGFDQVLFLSECTLQEFQPLVDVPGTRGKRAMYAEQCVAGNKFCGGRITTKFGRSDLDLWLPRILGAAESSDVFKVADTLPQFCMLVDKGNGQWLMYTDLKVAAATFSGDSQGTIVTMSLDLVGVNELDWSSEPTLSGQFPDVVYSSHLGKRPLRFSEGSFVISPASSPVTVPFESFSLTISNNVESKFYAGSDSVSALDEGMRLVVLNVPAAHTSVTKALYSRGQEALAARLKWQADNMNTQIDFGALKWPKQTPQMQGFGGVPLVLAGRAYRTESGLSGDDDDIKFTNDPVYSS